MARDGTMLAGRDGELCELDAVWTGLADHQSSLVVVTGASGIGKTALLKHAARKWNADGAEVITIPFSGTPQWDLYGLHCIWSVLKARSEELGDVRLSAGVAALGPLCVPETYGSSRQRSRLLTGLVNVFDQLRGSGPLVVVAEDLHHAARPELAIVSARRPGCLVVASCRDDARLADPLVPLIVQADRVIELGPLPGDQLTSLLAQRVGKPVDESLPAALRQALGPLVGRPGTVLSTLDALRQDDRMPTVLGQATLSPGRPIQLPADHELLRQVRDFGTIGDLLVSLAGAAAPFGVDDLPALASATGTPLRTFGHVVDELVAAGALVDHESGALTSCCPALTDAVLAGAGETIGLLHGELAESLLADDASQAAAAAHVVVAGSAMAPSQAVAGVLLDWVGRPATRARGSASEYYLAALRHSGPGRDDRSHVVSLLLHSLVREGRYDSVYRIAGRLAETADRREFAGALLVTALNTSVPVPRSLRTMLEAEPAALRWHDRWFAGDPEDLTELVPLLRPLSANSPATDGAEDVSRAVEMWDVAGFLEVTIGAAIPGSGPLAQYHDVVSGYFEGRWKAALSSARQLSVTAQCSPSPVHDVSRLLAAEICAGTGDFKQAAAWLSSGEISDRLAGMRGWVEAGLLAGAGDNATALADGWWAYRGTRPADIHIGVDLLLSRLSLIAATSGHQNWAEAILAEFVQRAGSVRSGYGAAALELVRGVVEGDEGRLRAAADTARFRGSLPDLLTVCLALGELPADPTPWLHEAHTIAGSLGAVPAQARVRALMRSRGVVSPRTDDDRTQLSVTEVAIIELILQGRTNRQISVALQVTQKTVEYYLSRLFAKTGCRSRIDLAAAKVRGLLSA